MTRKTRVRACRCKGCVNYRKAMRELGKAAAETWWVTCHKIAQSRSILSPDVTPRT